MAADMRINPQGFEEAPRTLEGPAGQLEAVVATPPAAHAPAGIGVVLHPHPQHGGTMQNKVVHTVSRTLNELGLATVRFNFRGVGASDGAYAEGVGETDDAKAVIDWARNEWPGLPLWAVGFSFGGYVAYRAASEAHVDRLVTIAPAVNMRDFRSLPVPTCPWLVIQGDADDIVPPDAVLDWVRSVDPAPKTVVLEGVGHLFHGHLNTLQQTLREALGE